MEPELRVLSAVAGRPSGGGDWQLLAGSLLTVPGAAARLGWLAWNEANGAERFEWEGQLDLGPTFDITVGQRLRAVRAVWEPTRSEPDWLTRARVSPTPLNFGLSLPPGRFSRRTLFTTESLNDSPRSVLAGIGRPVEGRAMRLPARLRFSGVESWLSLEVPPSVPRGLELVEYSKARSINGWASRLCGVEWSPNHRLRQAPTPWFVVGRAVSHAWISRLRAGQLDGELVIEIGWEPSICDPMNLWLGLRGETAEGIVVDRVIRIADLDSRDGGQDPLPPAVERPRLVVTVPSPPDGTQWGVSVRSADGELLDERPVGPRLGRFASTSWRAADASPQPSQQAPTIDALDRAAEAARESVRGSRGAASRRRVHGPAELARYLRWRLSAIRGELLLLDPYLYAERGRVASAATQLEFLRQLERPVRAITSATIPIDLPEDETVQVRRVQSLDLHDRVWIAGPTGLLVGASLNGVLESPRRMSTLADLPVSDVDLWRSQFETWWSVADRSGTFE